MHVPFVFQLLYQHFVLHLFEVPKGRYWIPSCSQMDFTLPRNVAQIRTDLCCENQTPSPINFKWRFWFRKNEPKEVNLDFQKWTNWKFFHCNFTKIVFGFQEWKIWKIECCWDEIKSWKCWWQRGCKWHWWIEIRRWYGLEWYV